MGTSWRLTGALLLVLASLEGQEQYRSPQQVETEWRDYTRFQKQELLAFSQFLVTEGYYERALLTYFQFLYRYPGDVLENVVYYRIARSYETLGNPALAGSYYQRVLDQADSSTVEYRAAQYRRLNLWLEEGRYDTVLARTLDSRDPYFLVFRGYAWFHRRDWTAARQSFRAAEVRFDHPHYARLLRPLYRALDRAGEAPLRGRWGSLAAALVPGGGYAYLKRWAAAGGAFFSAAMLYRQVAGLPEVTQRGRLSLQAEHGNILPLARGLEVEAGRLIAPDLPGLVPLEVKASNRVLLIPPLVMGLGIYLGSIWGTLRDVDQANLAMLQRYVGRVTAKWPVEEFLDFPEPELVGE